MFVVSRSASGKTAAATRVAGAALLCVALALGGCSGDGGHDRLLRVDATSDADAMAISREAGTAGLTALAADGTVVPGLAQSWRIADNGLSIVFRLRSADFSDGRALHAADVVATLNRARKGQDGPLAADLLAGVKAITTPVESIVEMDLTTPQPELLELLSAPLFGIRPPKGTASAGPFLADHPWPGGAASGAPGKGAEAKAGPSVPQAALILKRNPKFYQADKIEASEIMLRKETAADAVRRFANGNTDLVFGSGLTGFTAARLAARGASLVVDQPRSAWLLLANSRKGPLRNPDLRRAIALVIGRERLINALYGSQIATPLYALSPVTIPGYTPPVPDWAAEDGATRQAEARKLAEQAGEGTENAKNAGNAGDAETANGGPIVLNIVVGDDQEQARILNELAPDFDAIGIQYRLIIRNQQGLTAAVEAGDFDLALVERSTPADTPIPFLAPNLCQRRSTAPCNAEADRLFHESFAAKSREQRFQRLAQAEALWLADGATIGLFQPVRWSLVPQKISGFAANPAARHPLRYLKVAPDRSLLR